LILPIYIVFTSCEVLALRAEETPSFFRGLNLNGPAIYIDGNRWEGKEANFYACNDSAFENQNVPLMPATDPERAKMIRSSRYGGNRLELNEVPPGDYTLFLYVWEDNNSEMYSVSLNGQKMLEHRSGAAGRWDKLGPWPVTVKNDSKILLTSTGGAANFSGVEIWRGNYDGLGRPISEEDLAFFEKRIRPLLVDKCYECHSAESKEVQGELLVDSRATLRRGGTQGAGVVPGDLDHSLIIEAVRYKDDALQMPPDEKLSDSEIADLEHWVKIGAPDPRSTATKHRGKQIDVVAARQFWSLKAIATPAVPDVKLTDWPRSDIDHFMLAKMEERGLVPTADADKRALIRRATYDLIGIPPTIVEVENFVGDQSPEAFSKVVDRLLDSPRYGERWGRHWLDVVRYADTAGDNSDFPIPQIHRYRDWVIDAFNRDLPYVEFVRDQLAGDLRGGKTEQQRIERLIATGYLANSRRFGSRVEDYPQHLTIEDTLDNLGRTFLGLTISCARCHDHKFDPITNRDYYALYGIFHSTRYPWPGIELDQRQRDFVPLAPTNQLSELQKAIEARTQEQSRLDAEVKQLKDALAKSNADEKQAAEQKLKQAERRAKEFREQPALCETAYAVSDATKREDVAVQLKGNPALPGDVVARRFLSVLGGQELAPEIDASGREQLADWILANDNPLTARVIVNRLWQHHFGRGIVPTPNDFGKQGKPPTHPELLDHLANQLRSNAWSLKSLHRQIMLTRTYQQSSMRDSKAIAEDPSNDWLAGYPRRRLDAEAIRDTLLELGGNLDLSPAGPHPFPPEHSWKFTQHNPFKAIYETNRRSVFLMTQRIQRHPYLAIFDGADPSTSTGSRMSTTTPLQALYLLNDPFVHEQAKRVAERIVSSTDDDKSRVAFAFQWLFLRSATPEESSSSVEFIRNAKQLLRDNTVVSEEVELEAWQAFVRSLFRLNEFVYLD
jgi:regulator of replication initiation timing